MPYDERESKLYASLKKKHGDRAEEVYHKMLNSRKYDHLFSERSKKKRDRK